MSAPEIRHHIRHALFGWTADCIATQSSDWAVALPVDADVPSDVDVAFTDEIDEHASPVGGKGVGELGATSLDAAIARTSTARLRTESSHPHSRQRRVTRRSRTSTQEVVNS